MVVINSLEYENPWKLLIIFEIINDYQFKGKFSKSEERGKIETVLFKYSFVLRP